MSFVTAKPSWGLKGLVVLTTAFLVAVASVALQLAGVLRLPSAAAAGDPCSDNTMWVTSWDNAYGYPVTMRKVNDLGVQLGAPFTLGGTLSTNDKNRLSFTDVGVSPDGRYAYATIIDSAWNEYSSTNLNMNRIFRWDLTAANPASTETSRVFTFASTPGKPANSYRWNSLSFGPGGKILIGAAGNATENIGSSEVFAIDVAGFAGTSPLVATKVAGAVTVQGIQGFGGDFVTLPNGDLLALTSTNYLIFPKLANGTFGPGVKAGSIVKPAGSSGFYGLTFSGGALYLAGGDGALYRQDVIPRNGDAATTTYAVEKPGSTLTGSVSLSGLGGVQEADASCTSPDIEVIKQASPTVTGPNANGEFVASYTVKLVNTSTTRSAGYAEVKDNPGFSPKFAIVKAEWTGPEAGSSIGGGEKIISTYGKKLEKNTGTATAPSAGAVHTYNVSITFKATPTLAPGDNVSCGSGAAASGTGTFNKASVRSGRVQPNNSVCIEPPASTTPVLAITGPTTTSYNVGTYPTGGVEVKGTATKGYGSVVLTKEGSTTPVCTATVGADGSWSCPGVSLASGDNKFTATYKNIYGFTVTDTITLKNDTTPPVPSVTVTGPADGTKYTGATTAPTGYTTYPSAGVPFSGTATAGAGNVIVKEGDTEICTATVGADGSWSCPATAINDGSHSYTVTQGTGTNAATKTVAITKDTTVTSSLEYETLNNKLTLNAADVEAGKNVTLTGKIVGEPIGSTAEYTVGDPVTVTYNGKTYKGTVAAGGTFSVDIPGPDVAAGVLAGQNTMTVTVDAKDAAGNVKTLTGPVPVNLDANPPAKLTITSPANGSSTNQNVTAISGTGGEKDATITEVTVKDKDNNSTTVKCNPEVTVGADGSWTCNLETAISTEGSNTVSVIQTDVAGNPSEAATSTFTIDKTPPVPTVTLNAIATDGILNLAESGQPVAITGIAGGDAKPGDKVTVTVDDKTYNGTVATDGTFSIAVPGSVLKNAATKTVSATVESKDDATNVGTATATKDYTVDVEKPGPLTITSPANGSSTNQNVTAISGTGGEKDATITEVTVKDKDNNSTTVKCNPEVTVGADGSWTCNLETAISTEGSNTVSVIQTDVAGNPSEAATSTFTIDKTPPASTITIDKVTGDDKINNAEATGGPIAITGKVTGEYKVDDPITIKVGTNEYTGKILADGTFSVEVPAAVLAANTSLTATHTTTDAAGNPGGGTATHAYAVDVTVPTSPVITSPANETHVKSDVTVLTGTGEPGSTITSVLVDGVANPCTPEAKVGLDKTWSCTLTNAITTASSTESSHTVSVKQTDDFGNESKDPATSTFTIDKKNPDAPVVTGPVDKSFTNQPVTQISGTGEPGATMASIMVDDKAVVCADPNPVPVSDPGGVWTCTLTTPITTDGEYKVTASQQDQAGNTSEVSVATKFTVDTKDPVGVVSVSSVAGDGVVNAAEAGSDAVPVVGKVTGEFKEGGTVTVSVNGKSFTGTLDKDGNYTVSVPGSDLVADADKKLEVSYLITDDAGNSATYKADKTYTVDTELPKPVLVLDSVAGDGVVNAA